LFLPLGIALNNTLSAVWLIALFLPPYKIRAITKVQGEFNIPGGDIDFKI
jgi:hypothetical protein